ncbi:MAG: hypothetical protein MUF46_00920 [Desulfobacterales bacterium]|jgi:hypothetical protein|nr:hypothetical protein [Desulfobacterales bacterium]
MKRRPSRPPGAPPPPPANAGVSTSRIRFCDLRCPRAGFARQSALDGSCRTFTALWCAALGRHVTKNAPCELRFGRRRPTTGF